jgi:hypothetical protein
MIDFHTHIFPDKIAGKTIPYLAEVSNTKAFTNGTRDDLLRSTLEAGIDFSVILPVVTKPSQFRSINTFASEIDDPHLISFGGIHPATEDYKTELHEIKALGLKGIKLHPDYQNTYFNDIRYKRIVTLATELGLYISVHAGIDVGYPDPVHCTPQMALEVLKETETDHLILAHMGGYGLWDDVERYLVGQNVYLDTAYTLEARHMDPEQMIRIIRNHGSEKILFATDSPWGGQKEFVEYMNGLPLTEEEKENIFDKNARKLLTEN